MRLRALLTALMIACAATAATVSPVMVAPAKAQEEEAREAFRKGEAAYSVGNYELAIQEWDKAYGLDPRPRIQFNLAQAYERIGQWPEAVDALTKYLENADPDDPTYADANARRASLQQRLAKTGLVLEGGEDGGVIKVDDKEWGRTPRPDKIPVAPGSHQVVVDWGDRPIFQATVSVPPGQVVHLTVITPEAGGQAVSVTAGGSTAAATKPDNKLSNAMFYSAGGTGALTIASLAYFINRHMQVKDCGDTLACQPSEIDSVGNVSSNGVLDDMVSTASDVDSVKTQRTIGIVGTAVFGAATVGLVVTGLLLRDKGDKPDTKKQAKVQTRCGVGFLSGSCMVRF